MEILPPLLLKSRAGTFPAVVQRQLPGIPPSATRRALPYNPIDGTDTEISGAHRTDFDIGIAEGFPEVR